MTTNHIDKLDPALIRAGRIDRRWEFTEMDSQLVMQMARHFYPENSAWLQEVEKIVGKSFTAAHWQTLFKESRGDASRLAEIIS